MMIDITTINLYDWFKVTHPKEDFFKIRTINADFVTTDSKINKVVDEAYLQPIRITEKILKANGFQKTDNVYNMKIYEGKDEMEGKTVEIEILETKSDYVFHIERPNCDGFWLHHQCYVHQFQNALHLMGLSQMANYFKIA